jgi:uncharacterized protein
MLSLWFDRFKGVSLFSNGRWKGPVIVMFTGMVFAIGLALSGMTRPEVVIGFLNVLGQWDPSLAFVMVGAIGTHLFFLRRSQSMPVSRGGTPFPQASLRQVDRKLILGAALFGMGWGMSGICPGPGLVSGASLSGNALLFVGAMLLGMTAFHRLSRLS